MSAGEPLQVRVQIDREASPISGRIAADGSAERGFAGWTELCAAIDAAVAFDRGLHPTTGGRPDAQTL